MRTTTWQRLLLKWINGRSTDDAAEAAGVSPNTLRYWLCGRHLPPQTKHRSLAKLLGVTIEQLRVALGAAERER
jgi:transcriptional regulator with XRE-family HTH domain